MPAETPEERELRMQRGRDYTNQANEKAERAVYIDAAKRLGIHQSEYLDGWWVAYSPRNGDGGVAEGPWGDFVTLANLILEHDEKIRRGEATAHIPEAPTSKEQ